MSSPSNIASRIRTHLTQVAELRMNAMSDGVHTAVRLVKQLQAKRFRGTYADLIRKPHTRPALRFFLEELYGEHDFTTRDAQFSRIAGAIERLFPISAGELAVDLAETHSLTESLDHEMGKQWLTLEEIQPESLRYILAWRKTGRRQDRLRQVEVARNIGEKLRILTRRPSLRLTLRMMRNPARAAGLDSLQKTLETGFDAFAAVSEANMLLSTINDAESRWINLLFDGEMSTSQRALENEWLESLSPDIQ